MNNYLQLSPLILTYELIFLILYYFVNSKYKKYLSWPILINFFIIFVIFFCECNISLLFKVVIVFIKIIFLICLLTICEYNIYNYIISVIILLLYYFFTNINNVYNCDILYTCKIVFNSVFVWKFILHKYKKFCYFFYIKVSKDGFKFSTMSNALQKRYWITIIKMGYNNMTGW